MPKPVRTSPLRPELSDRPRAPRRLAPWLAVVVCAVFAGCGLSTFGTKDTPAGQPCAAASQCDDHNPCTIDTCGTDGVCAAEAAPDGDAAEQIAGDCRSNRCVAGEVIEQPNDADVQDDGDSCTADTCSDGQPFNTAVPDGTACFQGDAQGVCTNAACVVACGPGLPDCDDGNPCTDDACDVVAGQCAFTALHGVPVPGFTEPAGDCGFRLCVDGVSTKLLDATDLPVTANDCDDEQCNGGVPANPPLGLGTPCATSGGSVCDGQGACVECNAPADCTGLPADSECSQRTCVNHVCGQVLTPIGTPLTTQTPGDCQRVECDGQGATMSVIDDTDVLDDSNECTTNGCANGVPTLVNVPLNDPCGANGMLYCNGDGACVGCTAVEQCGVATFCHAYDCNAQQQCVDVFTAAGTALPGAQQVAGDCKENRCNGTGSVISVNVNDPNVDGNACTQDLCSNGVASNPPTALDSACTLPGGAAGYCDGASACVQCNSASQCPGATQCVVATCAAHLCGTMNVADGTPLPDPTPGDCMRPECQGGAAVSEPFSLDLPDDGLQCTADSCNGGTPTFAPEPLGTMCSQSGGQQCDGLGACKKVPGTGCVGAGECLSGFCADGVCCDAACTGDCVACSAAGVCQPLGSGTQDTCPAGSVCNGMGACKAVNGQICGVGGDCLSGSCADGVCCNEACTGACHACNIGGNLGTCVAAAEDLQDTCAANQVCNAGTCKLVNGQACAGGAQCDSGICVDDVCCGAACTGACQACDVAGSLGTCVPAADGQQDLCAMGQVCSAGACKGVDGQSCNDGAQCLSGLCVDDVCCGTACDQACQACDVAGSLGTCVAAAEGQQDSCPVELVCNAGTCKLVDGQACNDGAQCDSGICVDGVCCGTACDQGCQACDVPGNLGTCTILAGQQDSCAAGEVCTAAGTCKFVNGHACNDNGECAVGLCVDGICCNSACTGPCQTCDVPGLEGVCSPDPALQGSQDLCLATQACDATGACKALNGALCPGGDGDCASGFCADGVCCSSDCTGACMACDVPTLEGTCSPDSTLQGMQDLCPATQACDAAGACKAATGEPCADHPDCASGVCTANVCE